MVTLCISTTMVLVLLGVVMISVFSARNASVYMQENVEVTVYLNDTLSAADGGAMARQLSARPYAKQVRFFTKEQMCQKVAVEIGVDQVDAWSIAVPEIDINVHAPYANVDSLKKVAAELLKNEAVMDVTYPQDQISGMNRILNPLMTVLLVLAGLLIFICYTLINNSVQLGIYARRFSIHTMKLVGARWGFIRRPFLKKAIVVGLISAVVACVLLGGAVLWLYKFDPGAVDVVTPTVLIATGIAVFLFGFVIMVLCTLLSVNRFLRMTAGELFKV